MSRVLLATAAWVAVWVMVPEVVLSQVQKGQRTFTVADSIALTSVLKFEGHSTAPNWPTGTALFSPDGKYFLIRTTRGDVEHNLNIQSLLLYDRSAVQVYLEGSELLPPSPKVLAVESGNDARDDVSGQISAVRWVDSVTVAFLTRGDNGCRQAVSVNVETAQITELTAHPTDVRLFDISAGRLMFYANRPKEQEPLFRYLDRDGLSARLPLGNYLALNNELTPAELFKGSEGGGRPLRINMPAASVRSAINRIWQAPSGRYAIVMNTTIDPPAGWAAYSHTRWTGMPREYSYYQLVDLQANTVQPLLDAPAGYETFNLTPREVFWSKGGRSVIVTNTFVEKATKGASGRHLDRPAIVEIDLESGESQVVVFEPKNGSEAERILAVAWNDAEEIITLTRRSTAGQERQHSFKRVGTIWKEISLYTVTAAIEPLSIVLNQGLNQRPRIFVSNPAGQRKLLMDPNPQMDLYRMAPTQVYQWTDGNGRQWKAGLMMPPGYVYGGKAQPLVVQTHGFDENEYLVDGPQGVTSGFAAQALASAGIMVLQIAEPVYPGSAEEAKSLAAGYRQAIKELVELGVADPKAVGFIGWSYTGFPGLYLLTDYPELIAAATLSDAAVGGYMVAIAAPDFPNSSGPQLDPPNFNTIGDYFRRNPIYALARSRTPIRLEAIGPVGTLSNWEFYSILRQARQPVDLIWFPSGSHELMKPAERMASQGGTVDWFRFWLKGEENPETDRYKHWRSMKK